MDNRTRRAARIALMSLPVGLLVTGLLLPGKPPLRVMPEKQAKLATPQQETLVTVPPNLVTREPAKPQPATDNLVGLHNQIGLHDQIGLHNPVDSAPIEPEEVSAGKLATEKLVMEADMMLRFAAHRSPGNLIEHRNIRRVRQLYLRAIGLGDKVAAIHLGATYDATVLKQIGLRISPDPKKADYWYKWGQSLALDTAN